MAYSTPAPTVQPQRVSSNFAVEVPADAPKIFPRGSVAEYVFSTFANARPSRCPPIRQRYFHAAVLQNTCSRHSRTPGRRSRKQPPPVWPHAGRGFFCREPLRRFKLNGGLVPQGAARSQRAAVLLWRLFDRALARAAASCGRRSRASAPLPVSASTYSATTVSPSASANRATVARWASMPRPERRCRSVETLI
jgi:hypothetical protein